LTVQTPWRTFFLPNGMQVMLSKRFELIAGMRALTGLGGVGATAGFPKMREQTPAGVTGPFNGALTEGTPDPITSSVRLHVY
jgi:hypothetical protein